MRYDENVEMIKDVKPFRFEIIYILIYLIYILYISFDYLDS